MAQTYQDYVNGSNFVPPTIDPHFSFAAKAAGAAVLGAQESLLLTGAHAIHNVIEGQRAQERGETPLTQDQALSEFGEEFQWRDGEFLEQARYRYNYDRTRALASAMSQDLSIPSQFAFGMAGSLVDAPFMAIPGVAAVRGAKAAQVAFRTGTSFRRVQRLVNAVSQQSKMPSIRKALQASFTEQLGETQAVYSMSEFTGRDYGSEDQILDLAFGGLLATGINVPLLSRAKRIARQQARMVSDSNAIDNFFSSGDFSEGVNLLRKHSEDLDIVVSTSPQISAILAKSSSERTPAEEALVKDFLDTYLEDVEIHNIKESVELDPELPISEARAKRAEEIESKVAARKVRRQRQRGAIGFEPDDPDVPKASTVYDKAAARLDSEMKQGNRRAVGRKLSEEVERAQKVHAQSKESPGAVADQTISESIGPELLSIVRSGDTPDGLSVKEKIDNYIRETYGDTPEAEQLSLLAQELVRIQSWLKVMSDVVTSGRISDPTFSGQEVLDLDLAQIGKAKAVENLLSANKRMFQELMYVRKQMELGKMDEKTAVSHVQEYLSETSQSLMVRAVHDHRVTRSFDHLKGKSSSHILKFLKTILDGRARKGVATQAASVESKILSQVSDDQAALRNALNKHGMYDLFVGVATVGLDPLKSRQLHKVSNLEAQKLYGSKLEQASDQFWEDLIAAARTGEVPEAWKGIAAFEDIFQAYLATNESLRNQLNSFGAGIRFRQGYSGLSQRWSEQMVLHHGKDQWKSDMRDSVDWAATEEAHGGILITKTNEDGSVAEWVPFEREKFLEDWYVQISEKADEDHPSVDIVRSFGKHRSVVLHQGSELGMLKKYSGHSQLGLLYMDQVRHRSEMIAVAQSLGTRPLDNFDTIARRTGLDSSATVKKATIGDSVVTFLNRKHLDATVRQLTGSLDNPASKVLSQRAKAVRQVSNLAFLPLSGVSAISDIPMVALTLNQSGLLKFSDMPQFVSSYLAAHRRRLGGDEEMRIYLESEGAGLDAALNAAASRIAIGDTSDPNILGRMNDSLFSLNYLNGITQSGQEAFIDVLTRNLAEQLKSENLDTHTVQTLESYGFSTEDVAVLIRSVEEGPDGTSRVGPSTVSDSAVSRKLREMYMQLMNEAVLRPDVGTQALVRGGLKAGTKAGEAMRISFQYTSFPLAMTRIIMRKFLTSYDGKSPWTSHQTGMLQMVSFVGAMLAMGYLATVFKDILRGRAPMSLGTLSQKGISRIVAQSGVAGIIEPMLALGTGDVRGSIAPLPVTVGRILQEAATGDLAQAVDVARPFYGSSYPVIGPAVSRVLGMAFGESLQELQHNRSAFLDNMYRRDRESRRKELIAELP